MSGNPLHVDALDGGVVVLTLDVPDRRNAMTEELTAAWSATMTTLRDEPDLRCVVVAGAGPAFCSGGDLSWIGSGGELSIGELRDRMISFYRTWLAIRDLPVPTIAAINGPAVGAGFALALACDLRYAAPEARFAAPFTSLGMHAGMATTWLLPEIAGLAVARELLLTGRSVPAEDAVRLGLVNRILPERSFRADVIQIARTVAGHGPLATRLTKAALASGGHASQDHALEWEALAQAVTMASQDLREGLAAQRERRQPRFTDH